MRRADTTALQLPGVTLALQAHAAKKDGRDLSACINVTIVAVLHSVGDSRALALVAETEPSAERRST